MPGQKTATVNREIPSRGRYWAAGLHSLAAFLIQTQQITLKRRTNAGGGAAVSRREILDGRHRYQACIELGIEPKFENRNDVDPCQYVKDALPLREFTASIRALTFAELDKARIDELREKAKEAHSENSKIQGGDKKSENYHAFATLQKHGDDSSWPDPPQPKETARVNVVSAQQANVSPRTMADAIKVSEQGSEPLKAGKKNSTVGKKNSTVGGSRGFISSPDQLRRHKALDTVEALRTPYAKS